MAENAAAPLVASFMSLPDEIILEIFNQLGEVIPFCRFPGGQPSLTPLLTPLHINRKFRGLLFSHQPFWRLLARNIAVVQVKHPAYEELLNLCARQTNHTLDAIHFRSLDNKGNLNLQSVLRCIKIMGKSTSSLKLLIVPVYQLLGCCDDVKPGDTANNIDKAQSSSPGIQGAQSQLEEGAQRVESASTSQEASLEEEESPSGQNFQRFANKALTDDLFAIGDHSQQNKPASSEQTRSEHGLADRCGELQSDDGRSSWTTESSFEDEIHDYEEEEEEEEDSEGVAGVFEDEWSDYDSEEDFLENQYSDEKPMTDAIFALISKASSLETLCLHIKEWPQTYVIQALAGSVEARPTRLQFGCADWINDVNEAGETFCKALASKVEVLHLTRDGEDRFGSEFGPFGPVHITPSASLYINVMQSAASTLGHLEIEVCRAQLYPGDFASSRFDVLESLFVRFIPHDLELTTPYSDLGTRCQMPSLRILNVPANLLHLIDTKGIVEAGLVLEGQKDSEAVTRSLSEWKAVSTLVFYLDPYGGQSGRFGDLDDSNWFPPQKSLPEILKHLTPQAEGEGIPVCPILTSVSILNQCPAWWYTSLSKGGELEIEGMPRQQWDWHEPVNDPHDLYPFVLGASLSKLVIQRLRAFRGNKSCKRLTELRTIGFRIKRATRKLLRQLPPSFTFSYLAPFKLEDEDGEAVNSDIDAKSQDSDWVRLGNERRAQLQKDKTKVNRVKAA